MNQKMIGPIWIEADNFKLIVRWAHNNDAPQAWAFGMAICYTLAIEFNGLRQGHWRGAAMGSIVTIVFVLLLLMLPHWREKIVFDRATDCVRDLRTKYGLLGAMMQTEHGSLETITVQVYRNGKQFGVALRGADDKAIEPPMLMRFKKQEQAQEVADVLNVFLHQPVPTETPGVWPPPPRVPPARA